MAHVARIRVAGPAGGVPFACNKDIALIRTMHTTPRPLAMLAQKQSLARAGIKMTAAGLHTSPNRSLRPSSSEQNLFASTSSSPLMPPEAPPPPPSMTPHPSPLSVLPFHMILRSLLTTTVSSSPLLLPPSLAVMSVLAHTDNPILSPDRNPILRWGLKKTFYAQFCAGESPQEVRGTIGRLKDIGFTGVILGYAREVVLSEAEARDLHRFAGGAAAEKCVEEEVVPWEQGTKETVRLASPGDFVALKFTGAGRQALHALKERLPPPPALAAAIDSVCSCAAERGVRLLFDAEQAAVQAGIDDWTLDHMRKYNKDPHRAVIYGTYQAYLKSTPATLAKHLATARRDGFTLGVKLVRGAYLNSDPRHLIHDSKAETDKAYDGIAEAMLKNRWNGVLRRADMAGAVKAGDMTATAFDDFGDADADFQHASVVLASHNAESVRRARAIVERGDAKLDVAFGQLQGMADEISCELVSARKEKEQNHSAVASRRTVDKKMPLQTYKYLVWGSTGDCMKYLLRRAHENRDAVQRTRAGRDAMWVELVRRVRVAMGF